MQSRLQSDQAWLLPLMVGAETKTLAFAWDALIALNHIEGHIYANFIKQEKIDFPA